MTFDPLIDVLGNAPPSAYPPLGSLGPNPSSLSSNSNSSALGMLRFGIGAGVGGGFQGAREDEVVGVEDFPALPSANPPASLPKADVGVLGDKMDSLSASTATSVGGNASAFSPLSLGGGVAGGMAGASMADRVRGEAAAPSNPVVSKEGRYGLAGLIEVSKATDKVKAPLFRCI